MAFAIRIISDLNHITVVEYLVADAMRADKLAMDMCSLNNQAGSILILI